MLLGYFDLEVVSGIYRGNLPNLDCKFILHRNLH